MKKTLNRWGMVTLLTGLLVASVGLVGCGEDANSEGGSLSASNGSSGGSTSNGTSTSNGSTSASNGWASTSNGTTATSNGTTATSNGDGTSSSNGVATSNGTTSTSNATTSTSNGTTATSNGTTGTSNTNVSLGGSQDFGFFRRLLDQGIVPTTDQFDAAGFFAEHHTPLPNPDCGERICAQAMLGVMGNLMNGSNCTLLQVGLNSPIAADEANRPELSLAVVVDVSGSMRAEGKIDFVRDGLQQMLNSLNDDDQLTLVTYSDQVSVVFPMQPIRGKRNDLSDIIRGLEAGGATDLHGGLERGYAEISGHYDSGRQNRVILLSDGEPTSGITDPSEIVAMSRAFNSDGIGLTTVGLGTSFNYELMQELALQADGNYYFIEDAGAVHEVFTEELSYFTVPIAFDLKLNVNSGADYSFGRALGSPFWKDDEEVDGGSLEVPSVFLAHRTSHDDVTPDGGRRGGGSALLIELMPNEDDGSEPGTAHVAHVDLSFREPGTNRIVTQQVEVQYPYSPWETLQIGFFENNIVEKSFVMLNIFVALQEACDMFHDGQGNEAIGMLERLIAAADDYRNVTAEEEEGDDVDIAFDVELMRRLVEVIQASGFSEPDNNEIPDDPWPAD